jgi:glucose-6-phosphate 1-epimerase
MSIPATFRGQPCIELALPAGDRVRIALHGAHLLSWQTADGAERLYLSPAAHFDGVSPIRGGVPLCFPQFNQRALGVPALPKHGFARSSAWSPLAATHEDGIARQSLRLTDSAASRALWPHAFEATCTVELAASRLRLGFEVRNSGKGDAGAWPFALALHTYLHVDDINTSTLDGLAGQSYWDGVADLQRPEQRRVQPAGPLRFESETDRVYAAAAAPLRLRHAGGTIDIAQSASLPDSVVWNPGAERCASIDDMPADGYRQMLCVEAGLINAPQALQAGQSWSGWQELRVVA